MLYLIIHLYGDREDQKKWHHSFRGPLLDLLEIEKINRFVLTYHCKGKESDNLYLCIDVPVLAECTMDALLEVQSLQPLTTHLTLEIPATRIRIGNYEEEVRNDLCSKVASIELLDEYVARTIDNASRGSIAALKILSEGPEEIADWKSLVKKVIEYCEPLNGDEIVVDSSHYCFNSLCVSQDEEHAVHVLGTIHFVLEKMIRRLFNRESWSLQ